MVLADAGDAEHASAGSSERGVGEQKDGVGGVKGREGAAQEEGGEVGPAGAWGGGVQCGRNEPQSLLRAARMRVEDGVKQAEASL